MRVLRSHYLELQQTTSVAGPLNLANNTTNEKDIRRYSALSTTTPSSDTTHASDSCGELHENSIIGGHHGRSEIRDICETTSYTEWHNLNITFRNVPKNIKVKLHIHPVDMDNVWLSRVYRSYENDLWYKGPREPLNLKKKWCYTCLLCKKRIMKFESLKYHLNTHLELYPFACKFCGKPYASRKSAVTHLRKVHTILNNYKCYIGN